MNHPVDRAFENRRDNVAPVTAVGALQAAEISKQPGSFLAVRPHRFCVVDETYQLVAGDAVLFRRPIAPAVRRFERGPKAFARHPRFLLGDLLHVIEKFQKHDPGEHRQPVEIAVEPFVLPHDVAAGFHNR